MMISLFFVLFIGVGKVFALTYSTDVNVQFTFNPALQVDLSSADLLISNLSPGTTADSNVIDVIVKTNNITGYTLNATVGNNTTYDTRDLVHEVSGSEASFASINYGSSLASLTTDNTWGYSYSTDSGSNWEDYDGLPLYSDATNIATLKDASTPPATNAGDIINFKIAAKASASQASGDSNNVINFIATANPVPTLGPVACASGKICYNDNSLDDAEGTMGQQTASASTATVLLASNFSREGYGFAGWSDTYDYSGNLYGPQEEITTPADMSSGLSLYAIWIPSAGSMQTSDATSACNSLTAATHGFKSLASVTALTDQRDNETYAIAKLVDGRCWMIENLRLDNTAMLTLANTNNPLNDGTNVTLKHNYTDASTYNTLSATSSVAYNVDTAPDGWCTDNSAACDDQTRLRTDNTASRVTNPTNSAGSMYSYGNYYNWYSATAGRGVYSQASGEVVGDICPSGWELPYGDEVDSGNTPGGFYYLNYKLNNDANVTDSTASKKLRSYPNNNVYAGYIRGASLSGRGSGGYYWSSLAVSSPSACYMSLSGSSVVPGTTANSRYNGRSVRCIAQ